VRDDWKVGNTKMTDPIIESVKEKFDSRSQVGIKKYGTTLADNNKADSDPAYWLRMAQEEAMDLVNYLECEIQKIEKASKVRDD
jgi:hypothetical protein